MQCNVSCSISSTGIKRNMDDVLSPVLYVPWRFVALPFETWCRDALMEKSKNVKPKTEKILEKHHVKDKIDRPWPFHISTIITYMEICIIQWGMELANILKPRKEDFRELKSKQNSRGRTRTPKIIVPSELIITEIGHHIFILGPALDPFGMSSSHRSPCPQLAKFRWQTTNRT